MPEPAGASPGAGAAPATPLVLVVDDSLTVRRVTQRLLVREGYRVAQKHRDYANELGVDHYLGKPYGEEELLSLIGRYCAAQATSG